MAAEFYTLSLHDALPIFLVVFNRPINILCRVSLFLSMALCLLLRLFRNKETDRKSGSAGMPRPNSYAVFCLKKKIDAKGEPLKATSYMAVDCYVATYVNK